MNKDQRKRLEQALSGVSEIESAIASVLEVIEEVHSEEEDKLSNMPESLQNGDAGQKMQEAIDNLSNAKDMLENFDASELTGYLESASE